MVNIVTHKFVRGVNLELTSASVDPLGRMRKNKGTEKMKNTKHGWRAFMRCNGEEMLNHLADCILNSYKKWTGKPLLEDSDFTMEPAKQQDAFRRLFAAPLYILAHGTQNDPIFNFGSRAALELWEMSWTAFTSMPSRLAAEPSKRLERADLLQRVATHGYAEGYTDIRISSTGRRFYIENASIWNVVDENNVKIGQAAAFRTFRPVEGPEQSSGASAGQSPNAHSFDRSDNRL